MSTDLISLNPALSSLKQDADTVRKAMEDFRNLWRLEPCFLLVSPKDWRSGIKHGYLGLTVIVDPTVETFRLSA
jgi:hypothetical protein